MMEDHKEFICACAIVLLAMLLVLTVYMREGVSWDFIDHFLTARTLTKPAFYRLSLPLNVIRANVQGQSFLQYYYIRPGIYLELFRGIVFQLLLVPFILLSYQYSIPMFIVFMMLLVFASCIYAAQALKINLLLLTCIIFSYFILRWMVLLNGTEMLSIAFALFAIGLAADNRSSTGFAQGLTVLTKYPNLILLG